MGSYLMKRFFILSLILLGVASLFGFGTVAKAEGTIQIANCGESGSEMKAYDGKDMTCEFSRVVKKDGKIIPLHLKWNLPEGEHPGRFCGLSCFRSDGSGCAGATSKDGTQNTLLNPIDDIFLDPVTYNVREGNTYYLACLWRDSPSVPMKSAYTNYINIVSPCLMLSLDSYGKDSAFKWPGAKGSQGDQLRGSQAFLSDFYKLYQQMVKNKPTPDKCNPLKFDNGTCYISTQGQYTPGSNNPHGQVGAIDIVCDTHADGTPIKLSSGSSERCSVVDKLISRVKEANGGTQFSGVRECTASEWAANGSSALHLHLDQSTDLGRHKPCLFQIVEGQSGYDWGGCEPF